MPAIATRRPSFFKRAFQRVVVGPMVALFFGTASLRGYDAARVNRLTADWMAAQTNADTEIRNSLPRLIDRTRDLERNNDYVRGFLADLEANVIGSADFDLRMRIVDIDAQGKEKPDVRANRIIERAWEEWTKMDHCTVTGLDTWHDVKKLALRAAARDGSSLVRIYRGAQAGNPFGFALQLLEIDQLDLCLHRLLEDGNEIRFGIEYTPLGRPVAYYVLSRHPGDFSSGRVGVKSTRVDAADIIHLFVRERAGQSVGVPWLVSAITRLRMLGAYEEAELVAARVAASKMGFFVRKVQEGTQYTGDGKDAMGNTISEAEPGAFEELPYGTEFQQFDPQHPNSAFPEFRKACLRGIASALGVSYNVLGNDLENVNYSSIRAGVLDEREQWKMCQVWFDAHFLTKVFKAWLEMAMLSGAVALPFAKFAKFNAPKFKARRWAWVDPKKDIEAAVIAVENKFSSRRAFIDEQGGDVEDVFDDIAADEALAESKGIDLSPPTKAPVAPAPEVDDDEGETTKKKAA